MKQKYTCPYCGQINETQDICSNCHLNMNLDIYNSEVKKDYFDINIYISNNDYYKIIDIAKKYPNNLYYEYFMMFASLSLGKTYDINKFFTSSFTSTVKEEQEVCTHIIEKYTLYNSKAVLNFLKEHKYANILKFEEMLEGNSKEQVIEKDLREELFPLTTLLPTNQKQKQFKYGNLYLLLLSFILLVLFTVITIVAVEKELQYEMLIVALIVPSIFLTKSFIRIVIKKNNVVINIVTFLLIYYIITYIMTISYHGFGIDSFYLHLKRIVYTPFVLVKTMHERMN